MSWMVLGDVLRAHVAHAPRHACIQVGWWGHHGRVWDEGRQVGMGWRWRVVERGVAPWVELWLLR